MSIDHLSIYVENIEASKHFYLAALEPLGMKLITQNEQSVTFGKSRPEFKIIESGFRQQPLHIGFVANTHEAVDAFHSAALSAGGTDNGKPGFRYVYHPAYYGAFVTDTNGYNIEAVCHKVMR